MILKDADGEIYHVEFTHMHHEPVLNFANGKYYDAKTVCRIHSGPCNSQNPSQCTLIEGQGVSKKSVLDNFDRRDGLYRAFQRAMSSFPRSLRVELGAEFRACVRPPVSHSHGAQHRH